MELELPKQVVEFFGSEYGQPLSVTRLRKVANILSSNIGLRLRADAYRYRHAIKDWRDDLEFMRLKYYEDAGLKFQPWPVTNR